MQEAELTYIEGTVDAVIYQNQENGYTVLRLDAGEGRGLTVVGCLPGVAPGESISVQGTWMHHASYGEQFKAEAVERRMPAGTKAIFDYLASGAVRGIGAATARRMVEEFGEEALTVLEEHPERLTQIKGITRKRALAMGEHFRQQMGMRRLLEFLGEHEVPLQLAMPLYRKYGDRALEIIRGNPYLLVDRELGVDFSNADALALSMGMEGGRPPAAGGGAALRADPQPGQRPHLSPPAQAAARHGPAHRCGGGGPGGGAGGPAGAGRGGGGAGGRGAGRLPPRPL